MPKKPSTKKKTGWPQQKNYPRPIQGSGMGKGT